MAVVIRKQSEQDGTSYEIEDFDAYLKELKRNAIVLPNAKYCIFVSTTTAQDITMTAADLESQIALFFRLGPASGIEYEFREVEQ